MASSCVNLTPTCEKKESNEEALRENIDTLEKKIAEKEGIDVSDNVKEKPDLEKRKIIDSVNKDKLVSNLR